MKKPIRIGELISSKGGEIMGEKAVSALDAILVVEKWRVTIGEVMGRYCYDEEFDTKSGTLKVRIQSSILRNDLFIQRSEIVRRVNENIGRNLVRNIILM